MDQFFPETAKNLVRVLEYFGFECLYNTEQTCCGLPAYDAGYVDMAKELGLKMLGELDNRKASVCPSGACATMMRLYYPDLFYNTASHIVSKNLQKNLSEFTELILPLWQKREPKASFPGKVVFFNSCLAKNYCNIQNQPREILKSITNLSLVSFPNNNECCGFCGIFSIKNEPESVAMGKSVLELALSTGADYLVTDDASCLLQLQSIAQKQAYNIKIKHLIDVIAESLKLTP
jgi:L-lactate dehydrogenase complex protein LldE